MTCYQRFVLWVQPMLLRKAIADGIAALVIAALLALPATLLGVYNLNGVWTGALWSDWIAPRLPREVALAGDGVRFGQDAAIKGQRAVVNATEAAKSSVKNLREVRTWRELWRGEWVSRGDTTRSPMVEAWTRTLLLGEAWILKIQISWLLRLPFMIWRFVRRK